MNINVDFNKIFQSKKAKIALIALGALIVLLLVFQLGMTVGFRKANFSFRWAENYHQNFAGPRTGFLGNFARDFIGKDFIEAHGVFGSIIKIDGSTLVIKGANNVEKTVLLKDDTAIERLRETIKPADLKIDDNVVIIGSPNDSGQIEAKLIRVMPAAGEPISGQVPMPMMRSR
jgi:hypothetical protein